MFGDDSIEKCGACLEATLPEFPTENLIIHANLAPNTEHTWFIETVQGTLYKGTATTNGDGDIEIPISEIPTGLFASGAGRFVVYFKTEEDGDAVEITFADGTPYEETGECIQLTFYKSPNYTDVEIG